MEKKSSKQKIGLILIIIACIAAVGFTGIRAFTNNKNNSTLTAEEVKKVEKNLKVIISGPLTKSSNPYDQIKAHKQEFNEIVAMGEPVVSYFVEQFKSGKLDGNSEWVTAWICNEVLGEENPIKIWSEDNKNGWDSGSDWYEKYIGGVEVLKLSKFQTPDRIIIFSKGNTKELTKESSGFAEIIKLNNKRINSKDMKSIVPAEDGSELVNNLKLYGTGIEFLYENEKSMDIGKHKISYKRLVFKIGDDTDSEESPSISNCSFYYGNENGYTISFTRGLEPSKEMEDIIKRFI